MPDSEQSRGRVMWRNDYSRENARIRLCCAREQWESDGCVKGGDTNRTVGSDVLAVRGSTCRPSLKAGHLWETDHAIVESNPCNSNTSKPSRFHLMHNCNGYFTRNRRMGLLSVMNGTLSYCRCRVWMRRCLWDLSQPRLGLIHVIFPSHARCTMNSPATRGMAFDS